MYERMFSTSLPAPSLGEFAAENDKMGHLGILGFGGRNLDDAGG